MSVNSDTSRAGASRPGFGHHPAGPQSLGARIAGMVLTGVWLLYLIGPVADLATRYDSVPYAAGGLAIIVVFCALYLVLVPTWIRPGRYTLPGLGCLVVLAVVFCLFYGQEGGFALWIFIASASGLLVPQPRWAVRVVTASVAGYCLFSWTTHTSMSDFLGAGV